jgi:hypothetical protein
MAVLSLAKPGNHACQFGFFLQLAFLMKWRRNRFGLGDKVSLWIQINLQNGDLFLFEQVKGLLSCLWVFTHDQISQVIKTAWSYLHYLQLSVLN